MPKKQTEITEEDLERLSKEAGRLQHFPGLGDETIAAFIVFHKNNIVNCRRMIKESARYLAYYEALKKWKNADSNLKKKVKSCQVKSKSVRRAEVAGN